ncbi:OsmC family peroxiredoxin [Saccharicrinis sp. FJH2]|uniref:OsmC family peroxiredoxin n=1 Tax=unclassified Saccharicrinis TaxID=2646859 RepID=UPI0035D44D7E
MISKGFAQWEGDLKKGSGLIRLESSGHISPYSFNSRFMGGSGTTPEELIGAAHAGCFSMALSNILSSHGYKVASIETTASVNLKEEGDGFAIKEIVLTTMGNVPELALEMFLKYANEAKENCPVSKAISKDVKVSLEANLVRLDK